MNKIWTPKILLPSILTNDPRLAAAQHALEDQLEQLSKAARECIFLARLNKLPDMPDLPEHVLDLLAEQYHVDFYEPLGMDINVKREFIRNAILWHRFKGTPKAVETVLSRAFRQNEVKEWFEYGGEKYFFRIHIDIDSDDEDTDRVTLNRLRKAVHESKNARSWLEYYNFSFTSEDSINVTVDNISNVKPVLHDYYDYRVVAALYNGAFAYDGATIHSGVEAADFEVFSLDGVTLSIGEGVTVDDVNPFHVSLAAHHDTFPTPDDEYEAYPHMWHADTVEVGAELGSLPATLRIAESVDAVDSVLSNVHLPLLDSIAPYDDALLAPVQIYRYDGRHEYDGSIDYSASLSCDTISVTDDDDQRRWALLQRELERDFDERCTCGAADYEWWYSSIRLGGERFLLSDPQLVTVEIRCRRCSNVLAEYIVPSDEWEVRI